MEENKSVLFNKETGMAEEIPQSQAEAFLSNKTHEFPLNDPEGNPVSAPLGDVPDLLKQGYSQPTNNQLKSLVDYSKYSSTPEQIKTAAEGFFKGAIPFAENIEEALGVNREDIKKREEINPGIAGGSEVVGMIAPGLATFGTSVAAKAGLKAAQSALPTVAKIAEHTLPGMLEKAGAATVAKLGLGAEGSGVLAKVGSIAAKGYVENALFSAHNNASKIIAGEPMKAENVIADIGINGLIGAGIAAPFGVVSPLWKMTKESNLGKFLTALRDRVDGKASSIIPGSIDEAIHASGINVTPEIRAGLSENPELRHTFGMLRESESKSGRALQNQISDFKKSAEDEMLRALGKEPDSVRDISNFSKHEMGTKIQETMTEELNKTVKPISDEFEAIKNKYSKVNVGETLTNEIGEKIADLSDKYKISPSSDEFKALSNIINEAKGITTLETLRNLESTHSGRLYRDQLWSIYNPVKAIFRDAEERVVMRELGAEAPELITRGQEARRNWSEAMRTVDDLNDRLKSGKYRNPKGFIENISGMTVEQLANRIAKTEDAALLELLSNKLPKTAELVKQYHIDNLLKNSLIKAAHGSEINAPDLLKNIKKMSPELKNWLFNPDTIQKIEGVDSLIKALPSKKNPPGTAGVLTKIGDLLPAGVGAMISVLSGGHGVVGGIGGFIMGHLMKHLAVDVPDAAKLSLLKFLGSDAPINAGAFKSMVEYSNSLIRSEKLIKNTVDSVFRAGRLEAAKQLQPDEKKRDKIKKKLDDLYTNNEPLFNTGGDIGYYLPEHASNLSLSAARAVQYLQSLKPDTTPRSPLDPKPVASKTAESVYNRAIDLAEQPLLALESIKKGTLTPQDVTTVRTLYPGLYSTLSEKMFAHIVDAKEKGKIIPYKIRLSMSLFLGQDLDSTMTPQSIAAVQMQSMKMGGGGPQPQGGKAPGSMASLSKIPGMNMTPSQARAFAKTQA